MMTVLTYVFTTVFPSNSISTFPVFVLCGLIPFNFFSSAWANGTNCLIENAGLVKRVPLPRAMLPVASVLSNCVHLVIHMGVLLLFTLLFGFGVNRYWTLLPLIWFFEILFVLGLVMACSAIGVYVRDMRYVVESVNLISFWLVPIFYTFDKIPARFQDIYQYNPVAALVLTLRIVLMEGASPPALLILKLGLSSVAVLASGWFLFRRLQPRFYEHL